MNTKHIVPVHFHICRLNLAIHRIPTLYEIFFFTSILNSKATGSPDGGFIFVLVETVENSLFVYSQPHISKLLTKGQFSHLNRWDHTTYVCVCVCMYSPSRQESRCPLDPGIASCSQKLHSSEPSADQFLKIHSE